MRALPAYVMSHWRGEQPLWRALLLNALAVHFSIIVVLYYTGYMDGRGAVKPDLLHLPVTVFVVWACVGLVRSAVVEIRRPNWIRKIFAIAALGVVVWWLIEYGYGIISYLWSSLP